MNLPLYCNRSDLGDLAQGKPLLFDTATGKSTGVRLLKALGVGGMSTVFLGELEPDARAAWPEVTPGRLAIKIIKPSAISDLARWNLDSVAIARKEAEALSAVHRTVPPPEFIVRCFSMGTATVQAGANEPVTLPWISLEYVDGGNAGSTLRERVEVTGDDGIDPVRALRLARGLLEGVKAFHRSQIIHRDIKPENVFIAGPIDNEIPKIGDCGIARLEAITGQTVNAMTVEYAGPEQNLSRVRPFARNPLVGPWTDVHALATTIWFVLAGEAWFRTPTEWNQGQRRSLRTASRIHRGFRDETTLLEELDAVVQRGAAPALPEGVWQRASDPAYEAAGRVMFPAMFEQTVKRYESVDAFAVELLPILERLAERWAERSSKEKSPLTRFRPTRLPSDIVRGSAGPRAIHQIKPPRNPVPAPVSSGGVVFLPGSDGYAFAGENIYYFSQVDPFHVQIPVPRAHRERVRSSRWIRRGPVEGFALVSPAHVLLMPQYEFQVMRLPERADNGAVGAICAVFTDGRGLGIVTAATDDGGGLLELWRSADGVSWGKPVPLVDQFEVNAIVSGPQGLLMVGGVRGKNARAMLIGHGPEDEPVSPRNNVFDKPPLRVAVAGGEGESWAAGDGVVLRFDKGGVTPEPMDGNGLPVAMELDPVGIPWLLTERAVLRRQGLGAPRWRIYYEPEASAPPFVALGFTPMGARLIDAQGGGVLLEPEDITAWRH